MLFSHLRPTTLLLLAFLGTKLFAGDAFEHSVFDGKTLHGWTLHNDAKAEVRDGELILTEGDGWMRYHHSLRDFQFHVEWKAEKESGYDAGIYIRTEGEGKPFPAKGYQINLLEGKEGNIGSLPGASSTGLVKKNEWNAFDITVSGDRVRLEINGQQAYDVAGLKIPQGHLGFQIEVPKGGTFRLRNLRLTESGFESLFDGKSFAGWEGADEEASKCWKIEEGVLVCTGTKGPWLRSKEEYGDFNVRLEYMLSPGGNSGIYVRVPKDGNHHRANETEPAAGFEVQVLDDSSDQYKDLKDYQYSASVYDIQGANPRNTKPAGEWNTLEIDCRGGTEVGCHWLCQCSCGLVLPQPNRRIQSVIVVHNGETVVSINEVNAPLLKLRSISGFLGLQNHSSEVRYRNLRIGPSMQPGE